MRCELKRESIEISALWTNGPDLASQPSGQNLAFELKYKKAINSRISWNILKTIIS